MDHYKFKDCEVSVARRELLVGGIRRCMQPKVCDVLLYLLARQGRVVTKAELQSAVWKRSALSDSVIARTLMKVRRAIGDNDASRPLIRTLHGVGYCFLDSTGPVPDPESSVQGLGSLRVAILPAVDRIGRPDTGWIDLGMMSLLARALSEEDDILLTSAAATLTATDAAIRSGQETHRLPEAVLIALNVDVVVQITVTATLSGHSAACLVHDARGFRYLESVQAADAAALLPGLVAVLRANWPASSALAGR